MKRKFIFDQNKCVGCGSCVMACKNEFQTPPHINYRSVRPANENPDVPERQFVNTACVHCDEPACAKVCPVSAYSKRKDGVVVQNQDACIGCKACVAACPYGAPQYYEPANKVRKCEFCYPRLDANQLPSCVKGCPLGALGMIDLDTGKVLTSLGTVAKVSGMVDNLPELPDKSITKPNHRFILRKPAKQVRYMVVAPAVTGGEKKGSEGPKPAI
ncbi:MAG: 4Fe-4S dicluster domain-containing protein [Alphaproteobacteria bacterium]|uniref:4Fe-4S dicluster domain-containing protein n=1 Tax=Candidatus Nitrobium versatile TaxID=2884831 RepID=A0A953M094_9BACT|nr:4Fe-4S dicluster domain-containing protein [Candidatus Nitrobium versatile]